jgi:hypothetical protein
MRSSLKAIFAVSGWVVACGGTSRTSEPMPSGTGSQDVLTDFDDAHAIAHKMHDGSIKSTLFAAQGKVAELLWGAGSTVAAVRWKVFGLSEGTVEMAAPPSLETANVKLHATWAAALQEEVMKATAATPGAAAPTGFHLDSDSECCPGYGCSPSIGGYCCTLCDGSYVCCRNEGGCLPVNTCDPGTCCANTAPGGGGDVGAGGGGGGGPGCGPYGGGACCGLCASNPYYCCECDEFGYCLS